VLSAHQGGVEKLVFRKTIFQETIWEKELILEKKYEKILHD
jgi:hypothetical protein